MSGLKKCDRPPGQNSGMAFVKLKEGSAPLTLEQLRGFLGEYLGKHEMPHALELRAELPKTAVGKLSKKDLYTQELGAA